MVGFKICIVGVFFLSSVLWFAAFQIAESGTFLCWETCLMEWSQINVVCGNGEVAEIDDVIWHLAVFG